MKKLLIMFLLYSGLCLGQQGINYKAIIRDNGAVVQNQQIGISFTILEGGITIIYKELHVLNTDANGLVITNIGEGITTIGDFSSLDWSQEYFLNVEVDAGNGNVDMGTTAFKNVPYALHAKTATTITGPLPNAGSLEKITEDNNTGYRLADANPNFYGDIGDNAVDLSIPLSESSSAGATGSNSFASGFKTTASGRSSTTLGSYSTASGQFSTGIGYETRASGNYSTAMGRYTTAESYTQTSIGMYNTAVSESVGTFVSTDRLFVIGNGPDSSNKSDALVVLKNGTITAPSLTNNFINTAGNSALITKEYADMLKPKSYEIGDLALGGVVFWVDDAGQHGLVCSLENLSDGIVWMDTDEANGFNVNFTGGNGIGAGKLNTSLILSSNDVQNLSATSFATLLCATYSETNINNFNLYDDGGGTITISYGDWYLPSVYELSMLYPHKDLINTVCQENGGDVLSDSDPYWSSNNHSQTTAWGYYLSDNSPSPDTKNSTNLVRAVRSF